MTKGELFNFFFIFRLYNETRRRLNYAHVCKWYTDNQRKGTNFEMKGAINKIWKYVTRNYKKRILRFTFPLTDILCIYTHNCLLRQKFCNFNLKKDDIVR